MQPVDEFIEAYKDLEEAVRRVYKLAKSDSVASELKRQPRFEQQKADIQSVTELRNYLLHNSRLDGAYAAEPSAEAIRFVRELTAVVNNRPRCRDICVPKGQIISARLEDPVKPTMERMREEGHSSIPILRDGRVIGIFDERSFFAYVTRCNGEVFAPDGGLTFRDIEEHILVSSRDMQAYAFSSMNDYVDAVTGIFERQLENGKRIRMVMLTFSGKATDRLQGIITPWDIIAKA